MSRERFAIDVGGTFTDLILWDPSKGGTRTSKVVTTPDLIQGVRNAVETSQINLRQKKLFVHGTTVLINAILQGKGEKAGLVTTKGFRDVLEIGRGDRSWMYDILYEKPRLLVLRRFRLEIDERINAKGEIIKPLNEDDVRRVIREFKEGGIRCIAVCLLHSYANPAHEERVGQIIHEEFPEAHLSLSYRILRQHYEYERTVSAVLNCQGQPIMKNYLEGLDTALQSQGFKGTFLLLKSSAGAMTYREAGEVPVFTLMSGPAGGVLGGTYLGKLTGIENIITADAGGTSFDVCVIKAGRPLVANHAMVGGYKLLLPVLDISTIGAGGGSIASIGKAGVPQVGPQSAGSKPGPICYGQGGEEPTLTDCALVLGIINPKYFLGGNMRLDLEAVEVGLKTKIADPLGVSLVKGAQGILTIAESKMAGAIREMSVERGHDPREFVLLTFGGFGPLSACNLARKLSISRVLVPVSPATFSAWGMLMCDLVYDYTQTMLVNLDGASCNLIETTVETMIREGRRALNADGIRPDRQHISCGLDMKYWGQGEHSVTVPLHTTKFTDKGRRRLEKEFHQLHQAAYGHVIDSPVQIVNFRVRAFGVTEKPRIKPIPKGSKSAKAALKEKRRVFWNGDGKPSIWSIFERAHLRAGNVIDGPAIVEEASATTVIGPGDEMTVDRFGNLIIRISQ